MGLAAYDIIGNDAEWRVRHDGKAENIYETKEAAFEAAVAAASLAFASTKYLVINVSKTPINASKR